MAVTFSAYAGVTGVNVTFHSFTCEISNDSTGVINLAELYVPLFFAPLILIVTFPDFFESWFSRFSEQEKNKNAKADNKRLNFFISPPKLEKVVNQKKAITAVL